MRADREDRMVANARGGVRAPPRALCHVGMRKAAAAAGGKALWMGVRWGRTAGEQSRIGATNLYIGTYADVRKLVQERCVSVSRDEPSRS
jgi:hypothetical protein